MFTEFNILMYRCVTPLHCGATEAGDGIDLPVVRERYTNFPIIPATSLKGVWRDVCQRSERWDKSSGNNEVYKAFGPDSQDKEVNIKAAGLLGFVDAQLLYIPVRASARTFLLITCPLQLTRYNAARQKKGLPSYELQDHEDNHRIISETLSDIDEIYLEDIKLTAESKKLDLPADGVPAHLKSRLALVSDETFEWFASNATEIRAHNKLNDTKQSENLWYEEFVPAESIFFGQLLESPFHKSEKAGESEKFSAKLMETEPLFFQVGGNESTGHGLMEITPVK